MDWEVARCGSRVSRKAAIRLHRSKRIDWHWIRYCGKSSVPLRKMADIHYTLIFHRTVSSGCVSVGASKLAVVDLPPAFAQVRNDKLLLPETRCQTVLAIGEPQHNATNPILNSQTWSDTG